MGIDEGTDLLDAQDGLPSQTPTGWQPQRPPALLGALAEGSLPVCSPPAARWQRQPARPEPPPPKAVIGIPLQTDQTIQQTLVLWRCTLLSLFALQGRTLDMPA